jgi:hypothetical protein
MFDLTINPNGQDEREKTKTPTLIPSEVCVSFPTV